MAKKVSELPDDQSKSGAHNESERDREIIAKMYNPTDLSFAPPIYLFFVGIFLYLGWRIELENYITPESGLGYALGISGGVSILILLLYPLRKRIKAMSGWGPIRYWFRGHMMLGLLGPSLILYHCNFSLGAFNSNVALLSMALVVASGIIGRYIYGKIHYGLYGNSFSLKQLKVDKAMTKMGLDNLLQAVPDLRDELQAFEIDALKHSSNVLTSFFKLLFLGVRARLAYRRGLPLIKRTLRRLAKESGWSREQYLRQARDANQYLGAHLETVVRIVQFRFFERVFAIWHVLHIPLFVLLIGTGIYHVISVHKY